MNLNFTKLQGCGNDYVYIDCITNKIEMRSPGDMSVFLSDRHFGVGGDGMILILPSDIADAKMRIFNNDGSEAEMCGNGVRCAAKYLYDYGIAVKDTINIDTLSGVKKIFLDVQNGVVDTGSVDMGRAVFESEKIPVLLPQSEIINQKVNIGGEEFAITCVSMGNPHCVVFCDCVDKLDLCEIGPKFEHADIFPNRVNAEFVQVLSRTEIRVRIWERGSDETLACGTGACAAAVASVLNGFCDGSGDIKVQLLGGELIINYNDERVLMTGECKKVFDGCIQVSDDMFL